HTVDCEPVFDEVVRGVNVGAGVDAERGVRGGEPVQFMVVDWDVVDVRMSRDRLDLWPPRDRQVDQVHAATPRSGCALHSCPGRVNLPATDVVGGAGHPPRGGTWQRILLPSKGRSLVTMLPSPILA